MSELLPPGATLRLDAGHNPAAGQVLAESLGGGARQRPLHLVVGMLSTKDLCQFLAPLVPLAASMRFVPVPDEPLGRDPEASAATARAMGARAAAARSALEAVQAIVTTEAMPADILVCGSLYLAGDVLRSHG
jgi:dihydrofolate synthase/folylpolyglutamate synthase